MVKQKSRKWYVKTNNQKKILGKYIKKRKKRSKINGCQRSDPNTIE